MARADDVELGADFKHKLRLANSDVDGLRQIAMGLTGIKGVGMRTAVSLCDNASIPRDKLGGHLTDEEVAALEEALVAHPETVPNWMLNRQRDFATGEELHLFSQEVTMTQKEDIDRMRAAKSYRGVRHASGARVRGQRTRSNGRTGLTLGVEKKKKGDS